MSSSSESVSSGSFSSSVNVGERGGVSFSGSSSGVEFKFSPERLDAMKLIPLNKPLTDDEVRDIQRGQRYEQALPEGAGKAGLVHRKLTSLSGGADQAIVSEERSSGASYSSSEALSPASPRIPEGKQEIRDSLQADFIKKEVRAILKDIPQEHRNLFLRELQNYSQSESRENLSPFSRTSQDFRDFLREFRNQFLKSIEVTELVDLVRAIPGSNKEKLCTLQQAYDVFTEMRDQQLLPEERDLFMEEAFLENKKIEEDLRSYQEYRSVAPEMNFLGRARFVRFIRKTFSLDHAFQVLGILRKLEKNQIPTTEEQRFLGQMWRPFELSRQIAEAQIQ